MSYIEGKNFLMLILVNIHSCWVIINFLKALQANYINIVNILLLFFFHPFIDNFLRQTDKILQRCFDVMKKL